MQIPDFVRNALETFEKQTSPFNEAEVYGAIISVRKGMGDLSEDDFEGFLSEASAFLFYERRDCDSVWGTYFAPTFTATTLDGKEVRNPDVAQFKASVVEHWEHRTGETKNPVLRARYADLVWDLKKVISGKAAEAEFARIAIDAYIEAVERSFHTIEIESIQWLERALDLARSINDHRRTRQVVEAMFKFYDKYASPQHIGTWAFLFDDLYGKKFITPEEEEGIIARLEAKLAETSDETNPKSFDPFGAGESAERLSQIYSKKNQTADVHRVIKAYGRSFEFAAREASPMLAMAWLQPVIERYQQVGLRDDAERAQIASSQKGKNIEADMKLVSASVEIDQERIENFIAVTTRGNLHDALIKTAVRFIPDVENARKLLKEIADKHPLQALIGVVKVADGQIVAREGSVEDDPEGRLVGQLAQNIAVSQFFLVQVLDRIRREYKPTAEQIAEVLFDSPLFHTEARPLILEGLNAYLAGDFVKAIHVLIPQIEAVLRNFLGLLGIPTNKSVPRQPGIMQVKNINDILATQRVKDAVGENLWRYWHVFLADKRGHNLRNRMAHGLVGMQEMIRPVADQVLHVVLTLSLIREQRPEATEPQPL